MRLWILALLAGCLSMFHPQPKLDGAPYAIHYVGINNDCADPEYVSPPDDGYSHEDLAVSQTEWVRWVMCRDPRSVTLENAPKLDADPDPIIAAGDVAACVAGYKCDPDGQYVDWAEVAAMWDLAMRIDASTLTDELAKSNLPAYMQADYVTRYRAAQARVKDIVAARGKHWRDVFLKPALDARAQRGAEDEVLASWAAGVDSLTKSADAELVDGKPTAKTINAALVYRRTYVDACKKVRHDVRVCLTDGVGGKLWQLIQRQAHAAGNHALAAAEDVMKDLAAHDDPRYDEYLALADAFAAERARFAEYKKVKDSGVSAAALAKRWPEPPIDLGDAQPEIGLPTQSSDHFYASAGENTIAVDEQVRSVSRSGATATIYFRRDVDTYDEGTDCYETNRISSVDEYGNVNYEESCRGSKSVTDDRTVKPVQVAWADVAHVKAGEIVHVIVDQKTRKGAVVWVGAARKKGQDQYQTDTPPVQLREWRL